MHEWSYHGPDMFWIFIAVIVVSSMFFGYLRSKSRDETLRDLAQRGQPITPEMLGPVRGGRGGLLIGGLIMLFIGISLSGFMWSMGGMHHPFGNEEYPVFVGLFPGGIGLALLISYIVLRSGGDGR